MAAEKIGPARCPLCGGTASVSLSKSQLTVMTMNCCQAQLFTRSDRSDSLVRGLLLPPKADPAPVADVKPAAPETPPTVRAEQKATDVQPAPAKTRSPFAMFGADHD